MHNRNDPPTTTGEAAASTTANKTDEVDRIITAWSQQRPDLTPDPMQVFSRITRLGRRTDRVRRAAFATHNLEPWEFDVLASLRRKGKPHTMSPGQLMDELLVSSGTMTNRIDRLEAKGMVQRAPSATDRRAILVTATERGIRSVDQAILDLLEREREILNCLNETDAQTLASFLRTLALAFEDQN